MLVYKYFKYFFIAKIFIVFLLILLGAPTAKSQPVIIGHPADTAVCIGGKAVFYVLAINANAYQWQENDGVGWYNIDASITYASGYTTQVLTINDANLGLDGYQYRCLALDGQNNTAMSNPATLGVNEPPLITIHPQDKTVCKNDIAVFQVGVINADRYQWQESVGQGWINLTDNAFYVGTGSPSLRIFTTTGMNGFRYRCRVINGNCPDTTASAFLFVNPTPTLQALIGGGAYCEGGQGVNISLGGSESGISYHLQRNGNGTGIVISGTGQPINFGNFTQAGVYSVLAINGATSCEIPMLNSVSVVVNPLPLQQQLLGGGSFCAGASAPEIFLAGTQQNIEYQLRRNGENTGIVLIGNGFSQSFGSIEQSGFYTVSALNTVTGCGRQMTGNVQVFRNELPQVEAGADQTINTGQPAQLSASATSGSGNYLFNWQPASLVIQPQQANSSTIPLFQTQLFKVTAKDQTSSCISTSDSLMVFVSGGPLNSNIITDQTLICTGETVSLIASASGGSGNYTYSWSSDPPGFTSTGMQINVNPAQTTTYHLVVNDGSSSINRSVTITVKPLPVAYNLSGGGAFCEGGNSNEISLTGSQSGHLYKLMRDNITVATKDGTGQPIQFGVYNTPGNYIARATNLSSNCTNMMQGTVEVSVQQRPVASAGSNITIVSGQTATLNGSATGGSNSYTYAWTPANKLINPNSATAATIPLESTQLFRLQVSDQVTSCISIPSEVVVFVSGGSNLSIQTSASIYNVCPGSEVELSVLASGGTGNYSYAWSSNPPGFSSVEYNPVVFPLQTTKYIVSVSDGLTQRSDSVTIQVRPAPLSFQVTGGGNFCVGSEGKEIKLSSTQASTIYELLRNGTETGLIRSGNGELLNFGFIAEDGVYQIRALSLTSLCSRMMNGSATLEMRPLPLAAVNPDQMIQPGQSAFLSGNGSGGSGNYSFQWSPPEKVINPQSFQTSTLPLNQTQEFDFFVTDNQSNCTSIPAKTSVVVQGNVLEVSVSASSTKICEGDNSTLYANPSGGSGNYTFSWTSEPAGFFSTERNPVVSPSSTTNYILQLNDGVSIVTAQQQIEVEEPPMIFEINGGGAICHNGETVPIALNGSQNGVHYSLMLNNESVAQVIGTGNPIAFGLFSQSGSYTAYGKNPGSSCATTMNGVAVVQTDGAVIADAGPDKYLNQAGQVTLDGTIYHQNNSFIFNWQPVNKLVNPQALQPTTTILEQTSLFRLQAAPQYTGCPPSEDFAAVFVNNTINPLQISIFSNDTLICPEEQTQLFALASGGNGSYSYSWSSNPVGFTSNVFNPIVNPAVTTQYTVTVQAGDVQSTASFEVIVIDLPQQFQLLGGGSYCETQTNAAVELVGSETSVVYTLYRNGLPTNKQKNGTGQALAFTQLQQSGLYTIQAVRQNENCPTLMSGQAEILFYSTPLVLSSPDQSIPRGSSTIINGNASGGSGNYSYQWSPAAYVANPNQSSTITIPLEESIVFLFSATDTQSGCTSKADTTIVTVTGGIFSVAIATASTEVCQGSMVDLLAIPEGGSGEVSFVWKNEQGAVLGTNRNLSIAVNESMTIFLEASDDGQNAEASILIETLPIPEIFDFSGGGLSCNSSSVFTFSLNGSQTGILYQLYLEDDLVLIKEGNGQALEFGPISVAGNYHVRATYAGTACFTEMNGTAVINNNENPVISAGPDQSIDYGGSVVLEVTASGGSGNYSFQWQPETLLISPNQHQTASLPLYNTSLFNVKVTDIISNCFSNDQVTIFVGNQPNSINVQLFSPDEHICPGSRARLFALPSGGSGSYSYSWTSSPQGFSSSVSDPEVYPEVTTTYTVVISDGTLTTEASITIYVLPTPEQFDVFGGGYYCSGNEFANVVLSGSETGTNYTLFRNGLVTNHTIAGTGEALLFGPLNQSGIYTIKAQKPNSLCGRTMSGEANLQVLDPPVVLSGPDQQIISGQTSTLSAVVTGGSGSYSYHWQPSNLLIHPDSLQTQTVPLEQSAVFFFTATDLISACYSEPDSTIVVVTGGILQVSVISTTEKLCAGQQVMLSAIPQGGSGNYSYLWTDDLGNILGNGPTLSITLNSSTEISLALNDGDQTASATKMIEVTPFPQIFNVLGGGVFCGENEGAIISLSNSEIGVSYKLFRDFNQIVGQIEGTGGSLDLGLYNTSGVYTAQAFKAGFGCNTSMAGSALVQKIQPPVADAGKNQMIPFGTSTQLTSIVSGGSGNYQYNWQPANALVNSFIENPTTINLTESILFTLNITDNNTNCTATDQTIVFVSGGDLTLQLTPSSTILCHGASAFITAIAQGGTGNYTFQWQNESGQIIGNSAIVEVFPQETEWYHLSLSDGLVVIEDSVLISLATPAIHYIVNNGGLWCEGQAIPAIGLTGSQQGFIYQLYRNGNLTSFIRNGTGSPLLFEGNFPDGTYTIAAKGPNGCITSMQGNTTVQKIPPPEVFTVLGGGNYCINEPYPGVYISGSQIGYTYQLLKNFETVVASMEGNGGPIGFNTLNESGLYTIQASSNLSNCSSLMQGVAVYIINPVPNVVFSGIDRICAGDTTTISVAGADAYLWITEPPQEGASVNIHPMQDTHIALEAINIYGCSVIDSFFISVEPLPQFELRDQPIQRNLLVEQYTNANVFRFSSGGIVLQESPSTNFNYSSLSLGNDSLMVTAISAFGCETSQYFRLSEGETRINAFSPNSDMINDRFMRGSFIRLYNRWGVEIYSGDEGWDGRYKGSEAVPGTYYYIHEIKDASGTLVRIEKGSVTLVKE